MFAVKYRKIFYIISGILMISSYVLMVVWGFNIGTDFKGGTIIEVRYDDLVDKKKLESSLNNLSFGDISVRSLGDRSFIIRLKELNSNEQEVIKQSLSLGSSINYEIERFSSVGPIIGKELKDKAIIAIFAIIIITIIFVAYAFKNISKPVSSWVYGLVSIFALVHDITIPAGVAVVLGKFSGMEVDALFITALLSLLGYSINDTIVIFDKIRENLKHNKDSNTHEDFSKTVGRSLSETYSRSINTSLTTFLVLISLFVLGGDSIKFFILTLIVGTISGVYSSIFLAAPLLVTINNWKSKK